VPSPAEILEGATRAANDSLLLGLLWHLTTLAAAVALARGWRPSRRSAGLCLVVPLLSVSAVSWVHGNPFNGTVLLVAAAVLGGIAFRLPGEAVRLGPRWTSIAGIFLVALGWIYPHFLEAGPAWLYLVAAPLGVVPCPTLCAVIGWSLLADGFGSRAWATALAALGLFYGIFGAVRLGVGIDLLLAAGAMGLLALPLRIRTPARPAP
jgi:hypothetical protein